MYDMTIELHADGDCLYQQIYAHIKKEITEGKLLTGERLPSARSLAGYLQVSRCTVDYAYGQLMAEGYIESKVCKGYYVCQVEDMALVPTDEDAETVSKETYTEAERELFQDFSHKPDKQEDLIDFSPYDIDMGGFPFATWRKLSKRVLDDANNELFARGDAQGDLALRHTISRYLHSSRGVNCSPEQIIVGAGNDYLLLLLEKILGDKRVIAMENPTYLRSYHIFRSFPYEVTGVKTDGNGIIVSDLEQSGADTVYVMPSHQFPSGTVMPIGRRRELLKWAGSKKGRYLIEDDYDSEFRYLGKPIPALQSSDEKGRVIYLGSFSKAIAPAIRVSFMVLPEELLKIYRKKCFFYSCTVSRIDQGILEQFISQGYFERHLNRMRKIYRAKHELLLRELEPFRKSFRVFGENAGLHLLLTSLEGRTEEQLIQSALASKVRVYGLSEHKMEKKAAGETQGTVLLGFGGLTTEQISQGMERLKLAWVCDAMQ